MRVGAYTNQDPYRDPRVREWYADNPLRQWRFAHHSDARELEDAAQVPRGCVEPWETGRAVPDARQMRRLAKLTGMPDLAARWAAWHAARPAAPHIHLSDGHEPENEPRRHVQEPTRARYPWEMLSELVDEHVRRAEALDLEFSLVRIWTDRYEIVASDGPVQARALREVAAILESVLRRTDQLLSDDTGRFVLLLSRTSKRDADARARQAVDQLERDPAAARLLGVDHLDLLAAVVSYPEDGVSAITLLNRLHQLIGKASREPDRSKMA
jgi:transcriptional regulator with XRE-family HTH domain